jgi:hypothetical protein
VDQAWETEQGFWRELKAGNASGFYAKTMMADGFVVVPTGVIPRDRLIERWDQMAPARSCELSEPAFTVIEGGNVVITYHVIMDADWLPNYRAFMTALYTWQGNAWTLAFRAHTPETAFPFETAAG